MKNTTFCPICKGAKPKTCGQYFKCTKCGLVYVSKIAHPKKLMKTYTGGWLKSFRRTLLAKFRNFESYGDFKDFKSKADKITTLINKKAKSKKQIKLLDIGCNKGYLLHSAIQKGWDTYGVELVPELLIPFKKKYNNLAHQLFIGRFDDVYSNFKKNSFDVITAIDVIEHFEEPKKNIKKIYGMLKPGGIFVIQTPDANCKMAQQLGAEWGALKPLEHLYLFNKKNFETLMDEVGFCETKFFKPFEEADGNFVAISKKP